MTQQKPTRPAGKSNGNGQGGQFHNPIRSMRAMREAGTNQELAEVLAEQLADVHQRGRQEFLDVHEKGRQEFLEAMRQMGNRIERKFDDLPTKDEMHKEIHQAFAAFFWRFIFAFLACMGIVATFVGFFMRG